MHMKISKYSHFLTIVFIAVICLSCEKRYVDAYSSIYVLDSYGNPQCRMTTRYNLNNSSTDRFNDHPFVKPICVYYSGHWTAEILGECDWAYLSKTSDTGIHYFNFCYCQNDSGEDRQAIVRIKCDNSEEVDITLIQETL